MRPHNISAKSAQFKPKSEWVVSPCPPPLQECTGAVEHKKGLAVHTRSGGRAWVEVTHPHVHGPHVGVAPRPVGPRRSRYGGSAAAVCAMQCARKRLARVNPISLQPSARRVVGGWLVGFRSWHCAALRGRLRAVERYAASR